MTSMPATEISPDISSVISAVHNNCSIADARHASDYTFCIYLLKMREYYRWEQGLSFEDPLAHNEVSSWLAEREQYWETIEGDDYSQIPLKGTAADPFDADSINEEINSSGYVYSSGYGRNMRPHFFIGEIEKKESCRDYTLIVSGKEFARDITSPPAMSQGHQIFIRRESMRRMLWEKIEEWRWNKPANAMHNAIHCYDFDTSPEQALNQMTDDVLESAWLHEIGEIMARDILGEQWEELVLSVSNSKAEIMVRAVRDNLADAISTLPELLDKGNPAAIHFFMANMTSMRKSLYPGMAAAYEDWNRSGKKTELRKLVKQSRDHWQSVAESVLERFLNSSGNSHSDLVKLIVSRTL